MTIKDGHHRNVSCGIRDEIADKMGKLVVLLGKLATKESRLNRQFRHKYIRVEVEARTEIIVKETTKIGTGKITDQIVETEDSTDKIGIGLDVNQDPNRIIGEVHLEGM